MVFYVCFYVLANFPRFLCVIYYICCHYMWTRNIKFRLIRPGDPKDSKLCNGIQAEHEGPIWNKGCEKRPIWYIYIYTWFKNIYKSLLKVSPLIWAQKACQKLSKLINLAQFEAQTRLTDESDPFNRWLEPPSPTHISGRLRVTLLVIQPS